MAQNVQSFAFIRRTQNPDIKEEPIPLMPRSTKNYVRRPKAKPTAREQLIARLRVQYPGVDAEGIADLAIATLGTSPRT